MTSAPARIRTRPPWSSPARRSAMRAPYARGTTDSPRAPRAGRRPLPERRPARPPLVDVAPVVIPGGEASRDWLKLIAQGGGPETGQPLTIGAVDHQLEADGHGSLPKGLRNGSGTACP